MEWKIVLKTKFQLFSTFNIKITKSLETYRLNWKLISISLFIKLIKKRVSLTNNAITIHIFILFNNKLHNPNLKDERKISTVEKNNSNFFLPPFRNQSAR